MMHDHPAEPLTTTLRTAKHELSHVVAGAVATVLLGEEKAYGKVLCKVAVKGASDGSCFHDAPDQRLTEKLARLGAFGPLAFLSDPIQAIRTKKVDDLAAECHLSAQDLRLALEWDSDDGFSLPLLVVLATKHALGRLNPAQFAVLGRLIETHSNQNLDTVPLSSWVPIEVAKEAVAEAKAQLDATHKRRFR